MTDEMQNRFSKLFSDKVAQIQAAKDAEKERRDAIEKNITRVSNMWLSIQNDVVKPMVDSVNQVIKIQDGLIENKPTQQGFSIRVHFERLGVTGPTFQFIKMKDEDVLNVIRKRFSVGSFIDENVTEQYNASSVSKFTPEIFDRILSDAISQAEAHIAE